MLDRDEIKKRLKGVSRDFVAGFAVRAAMRVLPVLVSAEKEGDAFRFWGDSTAKHLFAVLHAQRVGFIIAVAEVDDDLSATDAADATLSATDAADAAAAHSAAFAALSATDAVLSGVFADAVDPAARSAAAADAAAAARSTTVVQYARYKKEMQTIIGNELDALSSSPKKLLGLPIDLIKNKNPEHRTALDYATQPLWLGDPPQSWLADWERFKQAVLSVDAGFSGFLDWFDDRIAGKPVDLDLLKQQAILPEEILAQNVASINAYLNALTLADKPLNPLNRVRAIFMGHGAAGKTSLVRCLLGEDVIEGQEEMTPGIDIREWPLPDSPVRSHLWDFGGQVIAHATHQFFLRTGCLYVLVMDARAEINATEQAQYWLEHVKAFAGSAPVMLVGNKADLVRINPDMQTLQERYPNIVGFYNLSCTRYQTDYQPDFDSFKRDFVGQLAQLDLHQVRFLDAHFNAMEALKAQSREQAFLTQSEFRGFCDHAGVKQDGGLDQNWLLDTLDKLGVIIHFPGLRFHDAYVLNPRWLTYGVYTLLYSDEAKSGQGQLTRAQVVDILQREEIKDEQGIN